MDNRAESLDTRWKEWVNQHENEDVAALALRYSAKPGLPLRFLLQQVKGRQVARHKLHTWYVCNDILYPDALSMEQCSSEVTARFKSAFVQGLSVADLTGGLGVDTWAFSQTAKAVLYNEPDTQRVNTAKHNLEALGCTNVHIQQATAEEATERGLPAGIDLVYIDPSRRDLGGRKVFLLKDLQPDVSHLKEQLLHQAERLMIKLSPMFDVQEGIKLFPETVRVDILSWKGECRELLFHLSSRMEEQASNPLLVCTELDSLFPAFTFRFGETAVSSPSMTSTPKTWLYEPHSAVRKAGPWSLLCKRLGMQALHPNTHLFTSENMQPDFPGRRFRILESLPYRPEAITDRLRGNPARMVFYNFPDRAEKVIAQLRIPSGEPLWLFFVTLQDGHPAVLLTEKAD